MVQPQLYNRADNLTKQGVEFIGGNFNYGFSNSTEGHIVFKNSNNGTTSGTVGLVADIVTDSAATGNISTNIDLVEQVICSMVIIDILVP